MWYACCLDLLILLLLLFNFGVITIYYCCSFLSLSSSPIIIIVVLSAAVYWHCSSSRQQPVKWFNVHPFVDYFSIFYVVFTCLFILHYCLLHTSVAHLSCAYVLRVHIYYMYLACINLLFGFFFLHFENKTRGKKANKMVSTYDALEAILSCTFDCVAMVTKTLQVSDLSDINYFIYNFYPSLPLALPISHFPSLSIPSFCEALLFCERQSTLNLIWKCINSSL